MPPPPPDPDLGRIPEGRIFITQAMHDDIPLGETRPSPSLKPNPNSQKSRLKKPTLENQTKANVYVVGDSKLHYAADANKNFFEKSFKTRIDDGWDVAIKYATFNELESWKNIKNHEKFKEAKDDAKVRQLAVIYIPGDMALADFMAVVVDCQEFFKSAHHFFTLPITKLAKEADGYSVDQLNRRQEFANYFGGLNGQIFDLSPPYVWKKIYRLEGEEEKDEKRPKNSKNVFLGKLAIIAGSIEPPTGEAVSELAYGSFNCCGVDYLCGPVEKIVQ